MNDLISIIVPIYNVEKYISKCIDSLIDQTYVNTEIILVDDGSTDQSGKICDFYEKKDSRIKVIHKKNGGLSDARNSGIKIAKGNYFSFIDGDDYINNKTIEFLYNAAINYDSSISICNMKRFYEDNTIEDFYCPTQNTVCLNGIDRFKTLNQPSVCNKLFHRILFDEIKFPKGKYYEDTFVYHELLYKADKVVLNGYNGYMYRCRKNSIIGFNQFNDKYFDFIEAVFKRADFLIKRNIFPYADEACLSMYASYCTAKKNIKKTSSNKYKFKEAKNSYSKVYRYVIKNKSRFDKKQIIRMIILMYFPKVHCILF